MQHIIVMIDSRLVSESCGAAILTCLNAIGVRYEVGDQIQPYMITFSREQAIVKESEMKKVSFVLKHCFMLVHFKVRTVSCSTKSC